MSLLSRMPASEQVSINKIIIDYRETFRLAICFPLSLSARRREKETKKKKVFFRLVATMIARHLRRASRVSHPLWPLEVNFLPVDDYVCHGENQKQCFWEDSNVNVGRCQTVRLEFILVRREETVMHSRPR